MRNFYILPKVLYVEVFLLNLSRVFCGYNSERLRLRFADYESTRQQDYEWLPLVLRLRFADYETTRLQDYEWLPRMLRRRISCELRAMSFEPALPYP